MESRWGRGDRLVVVLVGVEKWVWALGDFPEALTLLWFLFQVPSSAQNTPGTAHLPFPLSGWFVFSGERA